MAYSIINEKLKFSQQKITSIWRRYDQVNILSYNQLTYFDYTPEYDD